jgi:hypothetical protein
MSVFGGFGKFSGGDIYKTPQQIEMEKQRQLARAMWNQDGTLQMGGMTVAMPQQQKFREAPITGGDQQAIIAARRAPIAGMSQLQGTQTPSMGGALAKGIAALGMSYMGGKQNRKEAAKLKKTLGDENLRLEDIRTAAIDQEEERYAKEQAYQRGRDVQEDLNSASTRRLEAAKAEYYGDGGGGQKGSSKIRDIEFYNNMPTTTPEEREAKRLMGQSIARDIWKNTGGQVELVNKNLTGFPTSVDVTLSPTEDLKYISDVESVETNAELEAEKNFTMRNAEAIIQRAREVLTGEATGTQPTGSGVGQAADAIGRFFGESISGSSEATTMKSLGGWLTGKVPRFEGPQSDPDRIYYEQMAAKVGDAGYPVEERLAALAEVEGIIKGEISLPGGSVVDVGESAAEQLRREISELEAQL